MLFVFISLISFLNFALGKIGEWTFAYKLIALGGIYSNFSFEAIKSYLLSPVAYILLLEWKYCMCFGQLLGEKPILNEFITYPHLAEIQDKLSAKTLVISASVLCGFANVASIGIQVGGIGIFVPERKALLAKLGWMALLARTMAGMSTSVIAGVLF